MCNPFEKNRMEETNIEDQIGIVESNKVAYEVIMHDEGVSPLCAIQYFQDWYSSAVRLFYNVLGEDDTTFLHFRLADVTGIGMRLPMYIGLEMNWQTVTRIACM